MRCHLSTCSLASFTSLISPAIVGGDMLAVAVAIDTRRIPPSVQRVPGAPGSGAVPCAAILWCLEWGDRTMPVSSPPAGRAPSRRNRIGRVRLHVVLERLSSRLLRSRRAWILRSSTASAAAPFIPVRWAATTRRIRLHPASRCSEDASSHSPASLRLLYSGVVSRSPIPHSLKRSSIIVGGRDNARPRLFHHSLVMNHWPTGLRNCVTHRVAYRFLHPFVLRTGAECGETRVRLSRKFACSEFSNSSVRSDRGNRIDRSAIAHRVTPGTVVAAPWPACPSAEDSGPLQPKREPSD